MKHIIKGQEPPELLKWKLKNKGMTYSDLGGNAKVALKKALMNEQGFICCYCERELTEDDSHIEHIEPQRRATQKALDFGNMLCSCLQETAQGKELHCGHAKKGWFDEKLFVSPIDQNCETRFAFDRMGFVKPRDRNDYVAEETIKRLNLNLGKLRDMRRHAIATFVSESDDIADEDFKKFVSGYLSRSSDGKFNPFWSAIKDMFWSHVG